MTSMDALNAYIDQSGTVVADHNTARLLYGVEFSDGYVLDAWGEELELVIDPIALNDNPTISPEPSHWLYKQARSLWRETQDGQIKKGEEKYPQPLGDADWTWQDIVRHAVEENVDQMHYITLLQHHLAEMEDELIRLREENASALSHIAALEAMLNGRDDD
jgi:hypothetical protein